MNSISIPRRALAVASALALALALGWAADASPAQAEVPIFFYEAQPDNNQAGGHPDVFINFGVGNRYTQGSASECFCENPKDLGSAFPPG